MSSNQWICQDCGKKYSSAGSGFCDDCGGLILPESSVAVQPPGSGPKPTAKRAQGENGLGILVLDFSTSMNEPAFPGTNAPQTKLDLVANAFKDAMSRLKGISKSDSAYLAIIAFAQSAQLLDIFKASEIDETKDWAQWIYTEQLQFIEKYGDGTNITDALKLAREIYDGALEGDLSSYGVNKFGPMSNDVSIGSDIVSIPNVRVFLYSDGEHNVGTFSNPFEDASLPDNQSNINGLICGYFGPSETEGYQTLFDIAGTCPKHNVKGIIHINTPKAYNLIRDIFHMTSNASGFCAQCTKEF